MAGLLAISYAILVNGLALLGMAFILSLAFPWLRTRSDLAAHDHPQRRLQRDDAWER